MCDMLMTKGMSCVMLMTKGMSWPGREEDLEGPPKLKLSVLAGQLVALKEGLGKHFVTLIAVYSNCRVQSFECQC